MTKFQLTTILKKIADIYVVVMCIFYPYIDSSISESNIQYSMLVFHKCQVILTTTMLEYFVVHNICFYGVLMKDISNKKYQLRHIHLDQYFIQQNIIKISGISASITVYLVRLIYISWGMGNSQQSMLANTKYNNVSVDNYYQ